MATPRSTISNDDEVTDETIVGPGIAVRGRIDGEEDLRVEGRIEGSISLTETLYVEPSGVVIAEVEARDVVVSGIIIGDVTAANCVTLNKGAKLIGNIRSPRLIISDGAAFRGDVVMDGEEIPAVRERTRAIATVPRGAIGKPAPASSTTRARASVSGSYDTRRGASSTPRTATSAAAAAPRREVAPPPRPSPAPASSHADDDEVTVVVKHAALRKGELPPEDEDEDSALRRRAKKAARLPARGRRKAGRR